MNEVNEAMKENKEPLKKEDKHTCPHCGYCPHCGRSNAEQIRFVPVPYYSQYPIPYYPIWGIPVWSESPTWTIPTDPNFTTRITCNTSSGSTNDLVAITAKFQKMFEMSSCTT